MSKHSKPNDDPTTGKGGKPNPASSPPAHKSASLAAKAARGVAPREAPWAEVANFVVTFERRESESGDGIERRITAHKMQDDGITAKWTGAGQQAMCEWIANQVRDWVNPEPAESTRNEVGCDPIAARAPELDTTHVTLAIAQVRALGSVDPEPSGSGTQDEGCRTSFKRGEVFNLEALIEFSGLREADAGHIPPCSVQFFSRNTLTKERARLGEASIAERGCGQSSYRAVLTRVQLAEGSYRLESVAMLKGKQPKFAYEQVPLQVR